MPKDSRHLRLSSKILSKFERVGVQDDVADPIFIARFYVPGTDVEWFMAEYYPDENMFFGYASIFKNCDDEWAHISTSELEGVELYYHGDKFKVELDKSFKEKPASEVVLSLYKKEINDKEEEQ